MDKRSAEQYEALAEFLHGIGWKSPNDAQWTNLRDSMLEISRLACPSSHAVLRVKWRVLGHDVLCALNIDTLVQPSSRECSCKTK